MGLKWLISILWAFKRVPPATRTITSTFHEKKSLLLLLHFVSDGNNGSKRKKRLKREILSHENQKNPIFYTKSKKKKCLYFGTKNLNIKFVIIKSYKA